MALRHFFTSKTVAEGNAGKGGQQQQKAGNDENPSNNPSAQIDAEAQGDISLKPATVHMQWKHQRDRETLKSVQARSMIQWKQQRAREVLKNLQPLPPPSQTGPQWTPEHHRVLSENVRLLFDATSDTNVTENKGTNDEDDGEDEDNIDDGINGANECDQNESGQNEEDAEGEEVVPQAQTQVPQMQTTGSAKSNQGQKRQREEITGNSGNLSTSAQGTGNKRPQKRSKLKTDITQHVLEEFETLRPQPLQFNFQPHPLQDRSDEWFIEQFRRLFQRIQIFAHGYFGLHDIDGESHQPWAAGMTLEFVRHVEDVAVDDPMAGSWDDLLQNTVQREWLIVAVVMRVLEIHVFGAYLWGANPEEKDFLFGLERALFTREGFSRTALRSNVVRTIIGQGAITKNFHADVAELTAKVAILLKPLTFFLYSRPPKDGSTNRTVEEQYQALHNIIAIAAYLSICIRLSPTIFYFSNVSPNTPYNEDDQHSVNAECYTKSKEAVTKAYTAAAAAYQQKKNELEQEIARLKAAGKSDKSRVVKKAQAKLKRHLVTQPDPPEETHGALTKIGIWPNITRFKPGTQEDDDAATPLEKRRGLRIFEISRSAVMCYFGVESTKKRAEERVRLGDLVEKKLKDGKKERGFGKGVALATAAAAAVGIRYLLYEWTAGS